MESEAIFSARIASFLAARSRKFSTNSFKSQIVRDKLDHLPPFFSGNLVKKEKEKPERGKEERGRRSRIAVKGHVVNTIIGINVSTYLREAIPTISSRRTYSIPLSLSLFSFSRRKKEAESDREREQ